MSSARYLLVVSSIFAASLALVWPLLAGPGARRAVAFAGALCVANTVIAYFLARWAVSRSQRAFLGAVLGGMVGRMAVMLAAVVAGILVLGLPQLPLALAVLGYFVVFLILELTLLHRQIPGEARA